MSLQNRHLWSPADAAALYGINQWGAGNFAVSDKGEVNIVIPFGEMDVSVALPDIVQAARDREHSLPLLLRIENLLDARIQLLNESFARAIRETGYSGHYEGVYPVKVNQQSAVISEISRYGKPYGHGLEAGSKAELLLCLASLNEGGLLICNGYKDQEFIDLGLWANKLGHRCFFVIESPTELPLILERSSSLGIQPLIGLRIKISAQVGGLWTETSGDRSSFGLTTAQLVATVDSLREAGMLSSLQLLHCHLGSQIPVLEDIRAGVREASRFFADLAAEGVPLQYLDLGGGLAVDYIGNQSNHSHSCDYQTFDYCHCVAETIKTTLDRKSIPHPTIITESGRATVAHTSILLFNILDVMHYQPLDLPDRRPDRCHALIQKQYDLYRAADNTDLSSGYVSAVRTRDRIRELFRAGDITVRERAVAENLFLGIAQALRQRLTPEQEVPVTLAGLNSSLADIYYGNFSVFQSLPDSWAIGQMFPIMPIHRLDQYPERQASISDLTCDCDGKLDRFILSHGESRTLPLHTFLPQEDYILGVFLMGAYQETLGDLHNLFGDTDVISLRINEDGSFDITREQSGDTVAEILTMLEYNPTSFYDSFRGRIEGAVKKGVITVADRQQLLSRFKNCLNNQTYFKNISATDSLKGGQ
ncbi:MAG: biosynthetic arginine decarboxylase [Desulfuromonadales bacterium]|nr:biosynthetic arginine decarboxylase [Desulfuromonadales bacterium]MBN2793520.1 biosynthetic arginine decarboxylase [Desulfuromonadales bacterium]